MRCMLLTLVGISLMSCGDTDETLTGYANSGAYTLISINDAPAPYSATLILGENGSFSGQAPCNTYSGTITVPYPWFATTAIAATRMACPDLALESKYFSALSVMTLSETSGPILTLSNDDNQSLTFLYQNP